MPQDKPEPDEVPEGTQPATPAAAPAPAAVPVGFGAASGYGTASAREDDDIEVQAAVRATVTGPSLVARVGAELFGTFVVLLAGLGTALFASFTGAQTLGTALAFGFGTIAAFLAVAHVSGGHFNPAITLGSALAGRTPWTHVLPYWIAQLVGGALAAAVLFVTVSSFPALEGAERQFFSQAANGYDTHSPLATATSSPEGFGVIAALLIEGVLTAVLVGVYLGATDRRGARRQAAFAVGLTLAFAVLVAGPVTNAALNPVRATATAIFSDSWAWGQVWVFWVAPLVGAALAALLYRAFSSAPEDDDVLDEDLELEEIDVEVRPVV
ncbi:aquaporin [Cellulomonas endometrii]|nr:aquaporin [Cellulomonas endometrii]